MWSLVRMRDFFRAVEVRFAALARVLSAAGLLRFMVTGKVMNDRDNLPSRRAAVERRTDAARADIVQVGVCFMEVFGRSNAEAYFLGAEVEPAVYRRVMNGRFRSRRGRDADAESVPA